MWFLPAIGGAVARGVAGAVGRGVFRGALSGALRGALVGSLDSSPEKLPVKLVFKHNIPDTARWIRDYGKQIRYASAVALTRTARRLVGEMESEVERVFDKPVPFTRRAFGSTPATKLSLQSTVFIKDKQAAYLRPSIEGGRRGQKPFERRLAGESAPSGYWVPGGGVRLTAAGNMTQGQIREIASSIRKSGKFGEVFIGKPAGHPNAPFGIWGRPKRGQAKARGKAIASGLTPLLIKISQPSYKKVFDFYGLVEKRAGTIFNTEFNRAFADAVRSIRPIKAPTIGGE